MSDRNLSQTLRLLEFLRKELFFGVWSIGAKLEHKLFLKLFRHRRDIPAKLLG